MLSNFEKVQKFVNEINYITNPQLQEFVVHLLLNANDYFFTTPASTSGKYHPYFAKGEGGLVAHTRCVAFFAKCNAESFDLSENETNLLIVAAIAHDIKKQGEKENAKHTKWDHPKFAHDYIINIWEQYPDLLSYDDVNIIANAVLSHMGKWAHHSEYVKNKTPYPMPSSLFEQALQSADYIASRSELLEFCFSPTDNVNLPWHLHSVIEMYDGSITKNVSEYVMCFGKHKGRTIEEIAQIDTPYLFWVSQTPGFKYQEAQNKVNQYLTEKINKQKYAI